MFFRLLQIFDMDDQGIEARPPLGGENRGHGFAIGGVRAQAIDRLGRESDQAALRQDTRRFGNCCGVGCAPLCSPEESPLVHPHKGCVDAEGHIAFAEMKIRTMHHAFGMQGDALRGAFEPDLETSPGG